MEQTIILSPIAPIILLSIGIMLIAIETFITSFVVLWFGLGLFIVGLSSYYINFNDGIWQIALSSLIALVLLFTLRIKAMQLFLKSKEKAPNENFLNEKGKGIIKDGKVYYKSIYWSIDSDETFHENEKVEVLEALKGKAKIKKIEK